MRTKRKQAWIWLACILALTGGASAPAATETVLHTFGQYPDGYDPCGTPILDAAGNLYSTTYLGGQADLGTVFEREASGAFKVLYSFKGGTDGSSPLAGVIRGPSGNLYGTTYAGGAANMGVLYEITASGEETVLHTFTGTPDGATPYAGVVSDAAGNLYGTTYNGGMFNAGTVYELSAAGQFTVLYNFTGGADGGNPYAGVVLDAEGNLYGTTSVGDPAFGGGVYKVTPSGQETVLYPKLGTLRAGVIRDRAGYLYGISDSQVFKINPAGQLTKLATLNLTLTGGPASASMVLDAEGNLYGTTGLVFNSQGFSPNGAVFKVAAAGGLRVLYRFPVSGGGSPVLYSNPGVVLDAAGNLYGDSGSFSLGGAVYKIDTSGAESALYSFLPAPRGSVPFGGVIRDQLGNLYGTTQGGGPTGHGVLYELSASGETVLPPNAGLVGRSVARDSQGNLYVTEGASPTALGSIYKVAPSGQYTVLYTFTGGTDGNSSPGVYLDSSGNLYGTSTGTAVPGGLVFKLSTSGQFTVLHTFLGGSDGTVVNYDLTVDATGDVYGTTSDGGVGGGVIFKISPEGEETLLYIFTGGVTGYEPEAGVTLDASGNLYGTVNGGGASNSGAIYKLSPVSGYQVLYSFVQGIDGFGSSSHLAIDVTGNLYGTASAGGDLGCNPFGGPGPNPFGCGVVFELNPSGAYTVLHTFTGGRDGTYPSAGVVLDRKGNLYGTTAYGGVAGAGTVYKITMIP